MSIRVAIVEDDKRISAALARLVHEAGGFRCAGTYASAETALWGIPKEPPDAVLMDINLPGMSGVDCVQRLKEILPKLEIVMLTVYEDGDQIFSALQAGASGYLLKRTPPNEILKALDDVMQGGAPMSSYIARKVVQSFQKEGPSPKESENLSKREREVLAYVAQGYLNKEIADTLAVSVETIRSQLKSIYDKLHVRSRTAAAFKYFQK
ncbi:MAG: response regulator transcription factor [Verrucomicrobia bacterium]|nr:response regulator transcription factor [Verrucomicrobiota bacterium]